MTHISPTGTPNISVRTEKCWLARAFHEAFAIAEACDRGEFLRYMQQVEEGGVGYAEMSKSLAENGVEKWTFDTDKLTITYLDKAGNVLLREKVE